MDRGPAIVRPHGGAKGSAGARHRVSGRAHRHQCGAGRGAAQDRCAARARHCPAHRAVHGELPEELGHRVPAVACGIRPRQGFFDGVRALPQGRVSPRRQQAMACGAALGTRAARALQGHRRQVPALSLRALDSGAMARVPRVLRVRPHARLAARAAGSRCRCVRAPRGVRGARLPADAAADAPRLRKFHAGPGRMGLPAAGGLVALADAGSAAGNRRQLLRRPDRHARSAPAGKAVDGRAHPVPRHRAHLQPRGRADALASRAGRGGGEARRGSRRRRGRRALRRKPRYGWSPASPR